MRERVRPGEKLSSQQLFGLQLGGEHGPVTPEEWWDAAELSRVLERASRLSRQRYQQSRLLADGMASVRVHPTRARCACHSLYNTSAEIYCFDI